MAISPAYVRRPASPPKPMDLFEQVDMWITSRHPFRDPARARVQHDAENRWGVPPPDGEAHPRLPRI
jgi:hypothetical protein